MKAAGQEWRIDPERSTLRFRLRHIFVDEIEGRFTRWGGTLFFDPADPAGSRLDVEVELASVRTDNAERDAHVRSAAFFDVARYPVARFVSTDVRPTGGGAARVRGLLDLCGVKRYLELEVAPSGLPGEPGAGQRLAYTARGGLARHDFGLRWHDDRRADGALVGNRIELVARVEAVPEAAPRRPDRPAAPQTGFNQPSRQER